MKFNERLQKDIDRFREYTIIVEGQKDLEALRSFGFAKIYTIHKNNVSIRERIEQLAIVWDKKEKICILTDLDRQGKKLYEVIKPIIQELGFQTDATFRGILIKAGISHIEGIADFLKKVENMENRPKEGYGNKKRAHRWGGRRF